MNLNALDRQWSIEYAGGCTPDVRYNGTPNLNCEGPFPCFMKTKEGLGLSGWICPYTREHIGWGKRASRAVLVSPESDGLVKPGTVAFQWGIGGVELESRFLLRNKGSEDWMYGEEWFSKGGTRYHTLPAGEYEWVVETGGSSWSAELSGPRSLTVSDAAPSDFQLMQNYPNPFNSGTVISFAVPFRNKVELTIFDVYGRSIMTLTSNEFPAGTHRIPFDDVSLATGIYFYTMRTGSFTATRKMIVLR